MQVYTLEYINNLKNEKKFELESNVLSLEKDLEKIYEQNKLYEEYQSALEFNDKIDDKIKTLEMTLDKSKSSYDIVVDGIRTIENHILVNQTNKQNLERERQWESFWRQILKLPS